MWDHLLTRELNQRNNLVKQLVKSVIKKSFGTVGYELRRKTEPANHFEMEQGSLLVPSIWNHALFKSLIPLRLKTTEAPIVLLGSEGRTDYLRSSFARYNIVAESIGWDWQPEVDLSRFPSASLVVICELPQTEAQWRVVKKLKERYGARVTGIQELVLPFTTIVEAQASLTYCVEAMQELTTYYAGEQFFGPLAELDAAFPLAGRRVIEFGPMEGAQTAGLVNLGAESVTCIEARAVSFIKTMIAQYSLGWANVRLVMDDFHNADRNKYGAFDLAFAHGVYYHSFAPFLFFENLMSLSDNIFIGGYCLINGEGANDTLAYEDQNFRVRRIHISNTYNNAANEFAYHFDRDELVNFFSSRGYNVTVISDEKPDDPWGDWFLRFLACKPQNQ